MTRLEKKGSLALRRSHRNPSLLSSNPPSISTTPTNTELNTALLSSFPSTTVESPSVEKTPDQIRNGLMNSKLPVSNIPFLVSKLPQNRPIPLWLKQLSNLSPSTLYFQLKTFHSLLNEAQSKRLDRQESPLGSNTFSGPVYSLKASQLPQNLKRNRYTNILPFDYNRVKLNEYHSTQLHPIQPEHDYINASFINPFPPDYKGYSHEYISTQGPLPSTFLDFWTMIWNQSVQVIVMLTREEEKLQIKCHTYWPSKETAMTLLSNFKVELKSQLETLNQSCILRECQLTYGDQTRSVYMLQFIEWPDHSSSDPELVLKVIQLSHELQGNTSAPMVIHCSAGVGRTGTYCTIASVLKMIHSGYSTTPSHGQDLIQETISRLREQRMTMVQSLEQLILCYEAVLLALINDS